MKNNIPAWNHMIFGRRNFNHQALAMLFGGVSLSSIGCNNRGSVQETAQVLVQTPENDNEQEKAVAAKKELEEIQKKLGKEIREILKETETQMRVTSERCLSHLASFFDKAKEKVPEFADWALGFWSKTYYLVDFITFGKTRWNAGLLKEKFESIVISERSINAEMVRFSKEYMDEMEEEFNKMWVRIETTLVNYPTVLEIQKVGVKGVKSKVNAMIFSGQKSAQIATGIEGPLFLLSVALAKGLEKVIAILATQIATKAGASTATRGTASATVLGAGAAGSWATLGASMAGAVVIDCMLGYLLDYFFDPKGNLTLDICKNINAIHGTIINGNNNQPGLKQLMNNSIVQNLNEHAKAFQGMIQGNVV